MIHHLNCGTFRPVLTGRPFVAHCLLLERPEGLLLVDTGFGTVDVTAPRRLGGAFRAVMRPRLELTETALSQVRARGWSAQDVTDIVLTHLDLDHAGGVLDFPGARVHVTTAELGAARHPRGMEHGRYVPAQIAGADFVTHDPAAADVTDWFGMRAVAAVGDDVLLVDLAGHSRGHAGVAVRRPDGGWLLHAGDAFFDRAEIEDPPGCARTLRITQRLLAQDDAARREVRDRLQALATGTPEVRVINAHDAQLYADCLPTG
ncbi:MBL fold metallo-hydrolase [Nocardioides sp.]|uniref:MBL fold metallo-hydrolase n=1 Tax=Nocardioides sp. TaxID=35761 RepID=UPI003518D9ED